MSIIDSRGAAGRQPIPGSLLPLVYDPDTGRVDLPGAASPLAHFDWPEDSARPTLRPLETRPAA